MVLRPALLTDLLWLACHVEAEEGDSKKWCRLIGQWHPKSLIGITAVKTADDFKAQGLILGQAKGKTFHIEHVSVHPDLVGSNLDETLFNRLVAALQEPIRSIIWVADERDSGLHNFLSKTLRMKAIGVAHDWYANGHHGIRFRFPIGRDERGG